jgi:uncharacterized protein YyaL (SSP411 family)
MSRNQLDQSNSPYLLLHKDNPVHWYPWGREAFAAAEASGKPIHLSVGYMACHWCHVMEKENYADPETAALMNELFVNVKVDRNERPDVDQLYQSASNAMGRAGGWPLTMFLTARGEPYLTGTYFPKTERPGQRTFTSVLRDAAQIYRERSQEIATSTAKLTEQLNTLWNRDMRGPLDSSVLDNVALRIGQRFDIFYGGMHGDQKFTQPQLIELLWRAYLRSALPQYQQLSSKALDALLVTAIYDHAGGGFFRYCDDERWLHPHFEKIAADNAQILEILTLFWQHNRNSLCQTRMEETVGWLLREMKAGDAFAASLDADSEGEEGKFYLWTEAEIDAALVGTFSQKFKDAYGVTREGNYRDGKNALRRIGTLAPYPQSEADEALLARQCAMLLAARQNRVPPRREDTILADANGMVIAALANAGAARNRAEWTQAATRAFDFVVRELGDGDRLAHSWYAGKRGHDGFADDYAHMTRAALALWEATGESRFLAQAQRWVQVLDAEFWNEQGGGYFTTGRGGEPLFVRVRSIFDQTQPAANSVMIGVLARLNMATADLSYAQRAARLIESFAEEAKRAFLSCGTYFNNLEFAATNLQVVVKGAIDNIKTHELVSAVLGRSLPNRLLVVVPPEGALPPGHPAYDKSMLNGNPTAWLVQRGAISAPIDNPVALSQLLQLPQQRPPQTRPQ